MMNMGSFYSATPLLWNNPPTTPSNAGGYNGDLTGHTIGEYIFCNWVATHRSCHYIMLRCNMPITPSGRISRPLLFPPNTRAYPVFPFNSAQSIFKFVMMRTHCLFLIYAYFFLKRCGHVQFRHLHFKLGGAHNPHCHYKCCVMSWTSPSVRK